MKLLLDENIPVPTAQGLRDVGYDTVHALEAGLAGATDEEVLKYSTETGRYLVTLDKELGDLRLYPPGSHSGIIRLRLRLALSQRVLRTLFALLPELEKVAIEPGCLIVADEKRYRIRHPTSN